MKHIFIRWITFMIGISLLSSCSFFPTKKDPDFTRDYGRMIDHTIPTFPEYIQWIKKAYASMYPSGYDNSWLTTKFNIADVGSGSISFIANAVRESYQKMGADVSLTGSIAGNEKLDFDIKGKIVVDGMSMKPYYGFLEKFVVSGNSDVQKVTSNLEQYIGKWYVLDLVGAMFMTNPSLKDENFAQFMQGYMTFILEVQNEGLNGIKLLLSENPLLISDGAGVIKGKNIEYPVSFSHTGAVDLVNAASLRYTGSGISEEVRQNFMEELADISFSGILSVGMDDPAYYSLSGTLGSKNNPINEETVGFIMDFQEKYTRISLSSGAGIVESYYAKRDDGFSYSLTIPENDIQRKLLNIEYNDVSKIHNLEITLAPEEYQSGGLLKAKWPKESDGEFEVWIGSMDKSEYFETKGTLNEKQITSLNGILLARDTGVDPEKIVEYSYVMKNDSTFEGKITLPDEVGLEFTGHAKKDDFLVTLTAEGMTIRLENKKTQDTWKGLIQLPIGKMDWEVQEKKGTLQGMNINVSSPFIGGKMELSAGSDEWIRGPYSINSAGQTVSSGSLGFLIKPKYFGARVDTILPGTETTSFIEFLSMVDIRWDKDAKVEIPKDAILLDISDLFPEQTFSPTPGGVIMPDQMDTLPQEFNGL